MGASMEMFMIKTNFYGRVAQIEANRMEDNKEYSKQIQAALDAAQALHQKK